MWLQKLRVIKTEEKNKVMLRWTYHNWQAAMPMTTAAVVISDRFWFAFFDSCYATTF